jgi:phage terminase large subunit
MPAGVVKAREGGRGSDRGDGTLNHQSGPHPPASNSVQSIGAHPKIATDPLSLSSVHQNYRLKPEKKSHISLPNNWSPRHYQLPTLAALDSGIKRAISIWHRRAGKDSCALNHAAKSAHKRVGIYWHVLPTQKQARKVVWNNVDKQGRRMIDQAFPKELRKRTLDDEMLIEFKNGSFWQLIGGDNYDSNVGTNPCGVTFSEWAITDPRAWDFIRPILLENEGWSWFITTPRGKNHAYDMRMRAIDDPLWFTDVLTVDQTKVFSAEQIEQERREGMPESRIQQEYYCSFEVANEGTVFGREMGAAEKQERITNVPYDARYPVETAWDFGLRDATAIWFIQRIGKEVRFIDFICDRNKLLPHYLNLVNQRGYSYSRHIAPHDGNRQDFGSGNTFGSIAVQHGITFTYAPKLSVEDGIEAGRALLSRCWFDETKCGYGVKALKHHHREYDEELKVLSKNPVHDWSSDPCDAFRTYAVTPESYGGIPQWATNLLTPTNNESQQSYDPLGSYR